MQVEVTAADPYSVGADLVAVAAGPQALALGAPERAVAEADPVAMVYGDAAPLAVVALEPDFDGLRTAAARAVRACRNGGTVAWALDTPRRGPGARAGRRRRHRRLRRPPVAQRRPSAWRRALRDLRRRHARAGGRPRGARRPLDEHRPRARRRAAERDVPGRPRGAGRGGPATPHRDRRPHRGRARRAGRGRRERPDRSAAPRPSPRAARRARRAAARARREGRHVRHRRLLPQAAGGHRPPEGRHGGWRGRGRRARRHRRARPPAYGHSASCPPARTC